MAIPSSTLRKKRPQRKNAPAKPDEEKKARKPAYLKRKMEVSQPQDKEEQEADQVAREVAGSSKAQDQGAKENKEMISSKPVPSAQRLLRRINRVVARQTDSEEEEELQTKLHRAKKPEDEKLDNNVQRSVETEDQPDEAIQRLMRKTKEENQSVAARLYRKAAAPEQTDQQTIAAARLMRASKPADSEETPVAQTRLCRAEAEGQEQQTQADEGVSSDTSVQPSVEERIASSRGQGAPLSTTVLADMEGKFGTDLSAVVIHSDAESAKLCKELNARAFAVGNDIYFAPGEYVPETENGRELLAHELTHVVQQSDTISRKIYRANGTSSSTGAASANTPPAGVHPIEPTPQGGPYEFDKNGKRYKYVATGSPKELHLPEVRIPNFKQRHQSLYSTPLTRNPGPRNTNQRQSWRDHFSSTINGPLENKIDSARRRGGVATEGGQDVYFFKGTRNQQLMLFGNRERLLEPSIFPFWDRQQQTRSFQVDHRREDQLGGEDALTNYELLDAGANGSSGSLIAREINSQIGGAVAVLQSPYYRSRIGGGARRISGNPSYIKDNYKLQFNRVRYNLGNVPNGNRYWSVDQITRGDHLRQFRPLTEREVQMFGNPRRPMLYTSPSGGIGIRAPESAGQRVQIWPRVVATGPLNIVDENNATLPIDAYRSSDNPNGLQASYSGLVFNFHPVPGMGENSTYKAWAIDKPSSLTAARAAGSGGVFQSLRLPGLSPIRIDELDLDPAQGFIGRGKLLPSVPVLARADIDVVIQGGDVRLQKTFNFDEINVPRPFEIYHSSITAFMGMRGLGLEGAMGFGIDRLGEGELSAQIATNSGLAMDGRFHFDERLFGRGTNAEIRVGYRDEAWSIGGTITIPEGKVRGVRSATINVDYSEGAGFSARGQADLDVPGVESGTLEITQSDQQGFSIGGTFNLSADTPGIRGGSISATVREKPDGSGYAVSASGEAQPDIPGIDSNLTVSYDDGAFTAEFSGAYRRGMLSGTASVGVSNRTIGEDGRPSGEPMEGGALNIYGSGSATIQIAPWLQGTAGIRFDPNGEVTVSGEIGIPNDVEIFARREINKSLFNISVQVPIVPGIVAEVGGGLSAVAGIGPGVLDQMRIGIEYNPAHEENTHVTGDAHLRVPADAGLRLSVRAGIGLGITGASATGGLEIGGTLGIEGAAEAGVHIDWTPTTGLDLTANLSIHAQPSFTFDISGYVAVTALGFSVYDHRWQLASYQFGSDYRFGISLPVHYHEGEPFDISLDDVQFEVPDISPSEILSGLIDRIA